MGPGTWSFYSSLGDEDVQAGLGTIAVNPILRSNRDNSVLSPCILPNYTLKIRELMGNRGIPLKTHTI